MVASSSLLAVTTSRVLLLSVSTSGGPRMSIRISCDCTLYGWFRMVLEASQRYTPWWLYDAFAMTSVAFRPRMFQMLGSRPLCCSQLIFGTGFPSATQLRAMTSPTLKVAVDGGSTRMIFGRNLTLTVTCISGLSPKSFLAEQL
uniref:Putative secreted protein n=1 Tax=Ixodes ricinus TaxID=34613 RepID=A0A6B0UUP1_IXORI